MSMSEEQNKIEETVSESAAAENAEPSTLQDENTTASSNTASQPEEFVIHSTIVKETAMEEEPAESAKETEKNAAPEDDGIFSDLLRDAPISSLNIEEPEFGTFDVSAALEEARTITKKPKKKGSRLGKRLRQTFGASKPEEESTPKEKPEEKSAEVKPKIEEAPAETPVKEEILPMFMPESSSRKESTAAARQASTESFYSNLESMEDLISNDPHKAKPGDELNPEVEKELSFEELVNSNELFGNEKKPTSFSELLHSGFGQPETEIAEEDILVHTEKDKNSEAELAKTAAVAAAAATTAAADPADTPVVIGRTHSMPSLTDQVREMEEQKKAEKERKAKERAAAAAKREAERKRKEEEDNAVYDPKASLVDDYRYDEYLDKKRFLLSDYKKTEEYLNSQSRQGFHYVHHEGKKFYFIKGKPHDFYYKILYFAKEPSDEYWDSLEEEGWKEIDTSPSRNKRDAGWYVVRNERKDGDLTKVIENEAEKYRYFTKFSSSCRSTMFLLFVVMVCSAVSLFFQWWFKGFKAVMIASAVLFVIALWVFLVYARLLNKSRKQASLLAARLRLAENDPKYKAMLHAKDTDEELEEAWDAIDAREDDEDDEDDK